MPRRRGERGKIGNPGEIPVGSRAAGVACGVASSDNRGLRSRRRRRGRRRRCRCGDKCTCHAFAMSTGWRMKGRKKKKYSWTGARRRRRGGGGWRTEPQPRERPRCVAQTSAHRAPPSTAYHRAVEMAFYPVFAGGLPRDARPPRSSSSSSFLPSYPAEEEEEERTGFSSVRSIENPHRVSSPHSASRGGTQALGPPPGAGSR